MNGERKRLVITGASGLLGSNLTYYFRNKYDILGLYNYHPVLFDGISTEKCDLLYDKDVKTLISEFAPQVIIHCASVANIDECELDQKSASNINVKGTKHVVDAISGKNIKFIYISTDSVYKGEKGEYSEHDKVAPQNYYGLSKYYGELEALRQTGSLVLRTNLFGWNVQNKYSLGEWILYELKSGKRINGFKDVYFSSIYTMELSRVLDIAISMDISGVYNCGSSDFCSKFDFCLLLSKYFELDEMLIDAISVNESKFKTKRGKNLTLNVDKIQRDIEYRLPTISASVEAFYKDYKCGLPEELKRPQKHIGNNDQFIPYGKQLIDTNDIQEVIHVLRSERITQGPKIADFEKKIAKYCHAKYAVAMNSGTSALHIACLIAGIAPGDEAITSPITFVASANSIVYCGATPVFADIDEKTYNISPGELEKKITNRTKAIIAVHFAGQSCDMGSISKIVKRAEEKYGHKIFIIEDACHALGSIYKNTRVGSCEYSDMAILSFHPVKHITTGEGGVLLTNNEQFHWKAKLLHTHGITSHHEDFKYPDQALEKFDRRGQDLIRSWYYEQIHLGYNYRITDIQSALGYSQLKKIEKFRTRRREIVNIYNEAFSNIDNIQIPFESSDCDTNFHLYVLLIDFPKIGISRPQLMSNLKMKGTQTQVHYIPVHTQPFFQRMFGTCWGDCPNAEKYYQKCLSVPLFPGMTDMDVKRVYCEIKKIASGCDI